MEDESLPIDERSPQKPGVENPRTERLVAGGEEDSIAETVAQSYGKRPLVWHTGNQHQLRLSLGTARAGTGVV